jgi:hypothetical protein
MKYWILPIVIILISSCDPCKQLSRSKYSKCFNAHSDTITLLDTFSYRDTIIVPEIKKEWLIKSDTVINTERVFYSRKGDTTIVICKGDTLYREKEVIRKIKVPYIQYVQKQQWNWGILFLLLGMIALLLIKKKL